MDSKGEVIIYQTDDGLTHIDVKLEDETVWLTIGQMTELFGKSRSTINEHILNIFSEGELVESESVRKIGNSDFSTKPTNFYNLTASGTFVLQRKFFIARCWIYMLPV